MKNLVILSCIFLLGACAEDSGRVSPASKGAEAEAAPVADEATAPAPDERPVVEPPADAPPKAAIFLVGEELTPKKIQALGASLAGLDGVLAAKPDGAAGTFVVTFTPGQTTPEILKERLAGAAAGIEFMGLTTPTEIPANHDDCGSCPYKDKCSGAH